jgi:hypothetical protein
LRSKDQGWQNVPEQRRGNGAQRNDLAVAEAEPPTGGEALTDLLCDVGAYSNIMIILFLILPYNRENLENFLLIITRIRIKIPNFFPNSL